MGTITKNKGRVKTEKTFGKIDPNVGNYEKHPFFVKKANEAKALLKEVGLPKQLAKTKHPHRKEKIAIVKNSSGKK